MQGGTVTGRFSGYSNPNLQQIPARNKDVRTNALRGLCLCLRQDHKWGCFDYSQQEPRLVVHYAAEQPEPICLMSLL